jgi:hypothetical protein
MVKKKDKRLSPMAFPFSSPLPKQPLINFNFKFAPPPGAEIEEPYEGRSIPVIRLPGKFVDAQMRYELGQAVLEYGALGIYDPGNIPEGLAYASMWGLTRPQGIALAYARGTIVAGLLLTILDPQNKVQSWGMDEWGGSGVGTKSVMEMPTSGPIFDDDPFTIF